MGAGGSVTISGRDTGLLPGMWSNVCSMLWLRLGLWVWIRRSFWDGSGVHFVMVGWGLLLCRRAGFGLRRDVVHFPRGSWSGPRRHRRNGVVWRFSIRCGCSSVVGCRVESVIWVLRGRCTVLGWSASVRGRGDSDSDVWLWPGLDSEPLSSRWTVSFVGHVFVMLRCSRDLSSVGS